MTATIECQTLVFGQASGMTALLFPPGSDTAVVPDSAIVLTESTTRHGVYEFSVPTVASVAISGIYQVDLYLSGQTRPFWTGWNNVPATGARRCEDSYVCALLSGLTIPATGTLATGGTTTDALASDITTAISTLAGDVTASQSSLATDITNSQTALAADITSTQNSLGTSVTNAVTSIAGDIVGAVSTLATDVTSAVDGVPTAVAASILKTPANLLGTNSDNSVNATIPGAQLTDIANAVASILAGATIVFVSPLSTDGSSLCLTTGDSYTAANGQNFKFNISGETNLVGTIPHLRLTGMSSDFATAPAVVSGNEQIVFNDVPATSTSSLIVGTYPYQIRFEDGSGNVATMIQGYAIVRAGI